MYLYSLQRYALQEIKKFLRTVTGNWKNKCGNLQYNITQRETTGFIQVTQYCYNNDMHETTAGQTRVWNAERINDIEFSEENWKILTCKTKKEREVIMELR